MSKNELMVAVAASLTTLAEVDGSPESLLYMGVCKSNMDEWQLLRQVLVNGGFVRISGNYVTLTSAGRTTADKLNKIIAR